jgi:hypothetical protein
VAVNADGLFTVSNMSFVYNVLYSGNIRIISTSTFSSSVTIKECVFTVNGSGAVVPQSFIMHYGGVITIQESSFTGVPLSAQPLISFLGSFSFVVFLFSFC